MAQNRSGRMRTWARTAAAILLGFLLLQIVFDPLPLISDVVSVIRIRLQLPGALERWTSQGPSDYQIHVKGAIPMACSLDGELTVRDGLLVGVRMRANPLIPDSPLRDIEPSEWDDAVCPYMDLTVGSMFGRVRRGLEGIGAFGAPLTVKFDDEWGYIAEYRFGRASRGGVFGYALSECCTWFEFSDLRVLAP